MGHRKLQKAIPLTSMTRYHSEKHLGHVRSLPCLLCFYAPPSDPHHIQYAEEKSLGSKVGDQYVVPLCRACHNNLHQSGIGELLFWSMQGIDPLEQAEKIYAESPAKKSI